MTPIKYLVACALLRGAGALDVGSLMQVSAATQVKRVRLDRSSTRSGHIAHPWPFKNGNMNHTGFSPYTLGNVDLASPSWVVHKPVMHNTPLIDIDSNVYLAHTSGEVVSLDKHGNKRWSFQPPNNGHHTGNPAMLDDSLYICGSQGIVYALELATGRVRWETKVGRDCPSDAWVATADGTTLIQPGNTNTPSIGEGAIFALSTVDGTVKWTFDFGAKYKAAAYNMMPSIVDGSVVFQDCSGGVYRVSLETGKEQWVVPGFRMTMTTGGMVTGPDGVVYSAANHKGNADQGKGVLRAIDLSTGNVLWSKKYEQGINAAPAIGPLGPGGPLAVVIMVGDNFLPMGVPASMLLYMSAIPPPVHKGTAMAVDTKTGDPFWSYDVHPYKSWIYPQQKDGCLPDAFGNPAMSADGTVYVNWSGGYSYTIRDKNLDGKIDASEVSFLETNSGMNGETAIAPGLIVVPSCDAFRGYLV